jgi:hypothetical protein
MYIAHGTADTTVPMRQRTKLHDALAAAGVPHTYVEVAGAGHGPLGSATEAASRAFLLAELTRRFGDADRNGLVNLFDFNILAQHFGQSGGWRQGDFDASGVIDLIDFNLLAQNFGLSAGTDGTVDPSDWGALAAAAVPEPVAVTVPFAAAGLLHRFCRARRQPRV